MRSTASPVLGTPSSIKSIRGMLGFPGGKGARSHLTRPVTSYVPLTPLTHGELAGGTHVPQVPPPVTALLGPPPGPPGATKVPEPVSVICEPSLAFADAIPPALVVSGEAGGKFWLMMSQRTCWAWPIATELVAVIHNSVTPIPKSHRFLILMTFSPFTD